MGKLAGVGMALSLGALLLSACGGGGGTKAASGTTTSASSSPSSTAGSNVTTTINSNVTTTINGATKLAANSSFTVGELCSYYQQDIKTDTNKGKIDLSNGDDAEALGSDFTTLSGYVGSGVR